MTLPALLDIQAALADRQIDGWLLYDFKGQNPTALAALGLTGKMLTRRWMAWIPRVGEPVLVHHAIEAQPFADFPWRKLAYASWQSLDDIFRRLLPPGGRVAMEYWPGGGIPYLSRVDGGTVERIRAFGVEVVSSAHLVQWLLCRWDEGQVESHRRAAMQLEVAKEGAFHLIGERVRAGKPVLEHEVQDFLMARFADAGLITDHPPIVAVGPHSGDPHYCPGADRPTEIGRDQVVMIDLWAKENDPRATFADVTWMAFTGRNPSEKVREVWDTVVRARDVGLETIAARAAKGETILGWQIDRVVRDYIHDRGYGEFFVHRTGHNIGAHADHGDGTHLDDLETQDARPLVVDTCFSIEPGVYLPEFGVRSEINVFFGREGPKVYTPAQRSLRLLG